ncbi:hypothetical protein D3C76_1617650 [compost metagenome]
MILWKSAEAHARTGNWRAASSRYDGALQVCRLSAGATVHSIGLAIAMDRTAAHLAAGERYAKDAHKSLREAIGLYESFMAMPMLHSMQVYFEQWRPHLESISTNLVELQIHSLRRLARDVPY